jgi:hypothetical protein
VHRGAAGAHLELHQDRWLASRIAVVLVRSDVGEFPNVIVVGREVQRLRRCGFAATARARYPRWQRA